MDKPSSFAHKEMRNFCLSDDQDQAEIFCFACLVVLYCILRIKFPQFAQRET